MDPRSVGVMIWHFFVKLFLNEDLQQQNVINGVHFYSYADSAFMLCPYLKVAFNKSTGTEAQQLFNTAMRSVR